MKRNGLPVVGFGNEGTLASPVVIAAASPWPEILATTVVSAATGWALEEIAYKVTHRKRKRR